MSQGGQDLLVHLVANVRLVFKGNHILEARAFRDGDGGKGLTCELVAHIPHKEQHQHIILVMAAIHAATQLVATGLGGRVKLEIFNAIVQIHQFKEVQPNN